MHHKETQYGFEWGCAKIERVCSDEKKGWIFLTIQTPRPKQCVEMYITKTGKVKAYKNKKELK